MKLAGRVAFGVVVAGGLFLVGKSLLGRLYFEPKLRLTSEIATLESRLDVFRAERRDDYPPIKARLDDIVNRTLGPNTETVEAELRARLNRLTEGLGIENKSVSTGQVRVEDSPARRSINRSNPLRDTADFVELDATVAGEGSLEQVVRLVDMIEAEPWLKRMTSIDLDPMDGGDRFRVTVRLVTLFLPGQKPDPEASFPPYDGSGFARLASFVQDNHFRKPQIEAPAVTAVPEPEPAPADPVHAPPTFPYGQWKVTAVVSGSGGPEVWLVDSATGQSRILLIGDVLDQVELVATSDDEAVFQTGDLRFLVAVGSTMNDRRPVDNQL